MKRQYAYIAGLDCTISQAIRQALKGDRIIVPEQDENGKPGFELINFTKQEAVNFYNEISEGVKTGTRLIIRQ